MRWMSINQMSVIVCLVQPRDAPDVIVAHPMRAVLCGGCWWKSDLPVGRMS